MPLLKLLHFAALICWCGALIYLPALIAAGTRRSDDVFYRDHHHLVRMVFTLVATPAALLAIGSGTLLLLQDERFGYWLIIKLSTVAGMVLCHALCGALLLRIERKPGASVTVQCALLGAVLAALIGSTLWLVLAKPL